MSFTRPESCWLASPDRAGGVWHRQHIRSMADMERIIQYVSTAMEAAGYPAKEVFAVHLALEEAIVNAIKHGHQGDLSKPVHVSYHVDKQGVAVEVEDQGKGFDESQVLDPLACENLERPCGRGLLLIRSYMSGCCFNTCRNAICLCKHSATPAARA